MASLTRVGWYWNQLRNISVAELVDRAGDSAGLTLARRRSPVPVPPFRLDKAGARWVRGVVPESGSFVQRADEILSGRWRVLAMGKVKLGFPPEWNRNPANGYLFPSSHGKTVSLRDTSVIGDIKYLWGPNRHRELVILAQAWQATGTHQYLDAIGELLGSWFEQCPFPLGPNWTRASEVGIRLINWAIVWQLIGGASSPLFESSVGKVLRSDWLASVWRHAEFIEANLHRTPSANSQLIAELAGLYVAGATWPFWNDSKQWRDQGREGLEREVLRQISADGVNLEQSTSTQLFVWDALLMAGLAARATGRDFSVAYWCRLEAMVEYLAALMDAGGNVPMFGDADDGPLSGLALGTSESQVQSQLATGALLFSRPALARKAGMVDLRTRCLLGKDLVDRFNLLLLKAFPSTLKTAFPEGGVYVLGSHLDSPEEWRIVADAGALGMGGLAAHGHADALSFTLSVAGREFLVDPGTGTFHGPRAWRDGFRGTAMHNTLVVAGEDQAVSAGKFMWVKKYNTQVLSWNSDLSTDMLVAEHDGYRRLSGRPIHRRGWIFDKAVDCLTVQDEVVSTTPQDIALYWHFSEHCVVVPEPDGVTVSCGPVRLGMLLPPGGEMLILQGSDMPLGGWVSRAYDLRTPATTVVWTGRIEPGELLETVFRRL